MDTNDCIVCCESKEEFIACPFCKKEVCGDCFRTEMLSEFREPRCMLCKNIFLKEWILENQSKQWIRDHFWPYWGQWKYMMEKQRLPEDEEEAQEIRRLRGLREQVRELPLIKKMKKYPKKYPPEALENVRRQRHDLFQQIRLLTGDASSSRATNPRRKLAIISRCMHEECEGHVREDGLCALCGQPSCLECGGIKIEEPHRCDPVQRDSFRAIQRDTKPCPGCSSRVFFIGGCDQMWCTMCHTLFRWSTGQRVTEHIHNPHYYEWMSRQQKTMMAPIEIDGNDIPPYHIYSSFLQQHNLDHRMFSNLHRYIFHVRETVLPRLQPHIPEDKSLRLQYLTGDLTSEQWIHLLMHREKKRLKWTSLYQLTEAGLATMRDFVRLSIIRPQEPPTRDDVVKFVNFTQERIDTILQCYGGNQFHPSLEWVYKLIL